MEILLIIAMVAVIALPLHLLNRRDVDAREIEAAISADPRLRLDLMCARDFEERSAAMKPQIAVQMHDSEDELPKAA